MQWACVVLYFHVWPDRFYNILPHYRISSTIFERNMGHKMNGLVFSTVLSQAFFILRRTEGDVIKYVYRFSFRVLVFCRILIKLEFSLQIFEKYSNIKFHENPSNGSRDVPCGRTEGRTDRCEKTNSRYSKICKRAYKKGKCYYVWMTMVTLTRQNIKFYVHFLSCR